MEQNNARSTIWSTPNSIGLYNMFVLHPLAGLQGTDEDVWDPPRGGGFKKPPPPSNLFPPIMPCRNNCGKNVRNPSSRVVKFNVCDRCLEAECAQGLCCHCATSVAADNFFVSKPFVHPDFDCCAACRHNVTYRCTITNR